MYPPVPPRVVYQDVPTCGYLDVDHTIAPLVAHGKTCASCLGGGWVERVKMLSPQIVFSAGLGGGDVSLLYKAMTKNILTEDLSHKKKSQTKLFSLSQH